MKTPQQINIVKTRKENNESSFEKKNVMGLNKRSLTEIKGGWTTTFLSNLTTLTNFSRDTICTSDAQKEYKREKRIIKIKNTNYENTKQRQAGIY